MSSAVDALKRALRPAVSKDPAELVEAAGGGPALARMLVGLPATGRLPKPGTKIRKRYNAAIRQIQRYTTTAGQRRGQGSAGVSSAARDKAIARWRGVVGPTWRSSFYDRLRAKGGRTRVAGGWRVGGSKDTRRYRMLPTGGDGAKLATSYTGRMLNAVEVGDWERALAVFLEGFSDGYDVEVTVEDEGGPEDIDWIKIWVDGDREPRR